MQTINSISALIASIIAAAANAGGTYITDASHDVTFLASKQSLNTGRPKCLLPASEKWL